MPWRRRRPGSGAPCRQSLWAPILWLLEPRSSFSSDSASSSTQRPSEACSPGDMAKGDEQEASPEAGISNGLRTEGLA